MIQVFAAMKKCTNVILDANLIFIFTFGYIWQEIKLDIVHLFFPLDCFIHRFPLLQMKSTELFDAISKI